MATTGDYLRIWELTGLEDTTAHTLDSQGQLQSSTELILNATLANVRKSGQVCSSFFF